MSASGQFATTRWSVVARAADCSEDDRRTAMTTLCEAYWFPLYVYVRRRVANVEDARDLVQAFFAELLEKDVVADADPQRGRFRAFLIAALKNFMAKQWQRQRARKRGGGQVVLRLDFDYGDSRIQVESISTLTADQQYERSWAITVLDKVLANLHDEMADAGKAREFELLRGAVIGDHDALSYRQIADELKMTDAAVRMTASRLRQRFRQLLRARIADTVLSPDTVDDEIRHLFRVLSLP